MAIIYFEGTVQIRPIFLCVAIIYFEGSVQDPSVSYSVAMLSLVGQTWRPLLEIFAQNIISFVTFLLADAVRLFIRPESSFIVMLKIKLYGRTGN